MIKFFRRIRYNLMEKNKTGKYFKYAIGEIVLVVIGILIALSINNWNEGRKLEVQKQELITSLISDFETTKTRLDESILVAEIISSKMNSFLSVTHENSHLTLDSLKILSHSIFHRIKFKPLLDTYKRSLSTGTFALIKNNLLFSYFPEFYQELDDFKLHEDLSGDLMFKGSVWEIRKKLGSIELLKSNRKKIPKEFELSNQEFRELIKQKWFYAAYENQAWVQKNMLNSLKNIDTALKKILIELKKQND